MSQTAVAFIFHTEGRMPHEATRFPLHAVPLVRERVSDLLQREHAKALVSSAACGADLIALEQAERLIVRRRVVLPFAPERFRF